MPYESNSFDTVISIKLHNLDKNDCFKSIKEIERVSKKGSFITVDAYRNEEEKRMEDGIQLLNNNSKRWKYFG